MDANFPACLAVILASEGGFVVDQGGPTNFGVTQQTLGRWLGRPATEADVRALTAEQAAAIYGLFYWRPAHGPDLPAGVDLAVFDQAVNEGVEHAIRQLQAALGVRVDGVFGPLTLAAVHAAAPAELVGRLHDLNAAFYESLGREYPQDEGGWQARNDRTRDAALRMVSTEGEGALT